MARNLALTRARRDQIDERWPFDDPNPVGSASEQIEDAITHLERDPSSLVRWPFPDLHTLTGPMGGGEVWFTAAFSGGGKTTFVVSCIEAWRKMGKKVYVMPLELQPYRFRTYLACMQTGTAPGDALSGELRADERRAGERARLIEALNAQRDPAYVRYVRVSELRAINVKGLEQGLREAKAFGADIVIVDHIDHIAGGDGSRLFAESLAVNDAALKMAQDNDLLLWFTSQLNMEISRGRDHMAKFGPPMQHHLLFPSAKIKNATGIIGLFRPMRPLNPGEGVKEYKAALAAARNGETDAPEMLAKGVMGVNAMKLRNRGQNEGKKITLGFERGRVMPLEERGQPDQRELMPNA